VPVVALHTPATWQTSLATQVTGLPPTQVPAWQLSACVQALPSLHAVPFGLGGFVQVPVVALHTPAAWQASLATQVTGLPPTQAPAWPLSVRVQALPSLHAVPFGLGGFEQVPVAALHTPARWQTSLGVQDTGLPPTQAPAWQLSVRVQALPSLHVVPLGAFPTTQVASTQVSTVQALPSSQLAFE